MKLKASIIIPIFNEEKTIAFAIDSLSRQKYKNTEIIIVDDGSTDNSKYIVKRYKGIKLVESKHNGMAEARKLGVLASSGEALLFLDGDLLYNENFVEELIMPLRNPKVAGTYSISEYVANSHNVWSSCWNTNLNLPIGRKITNTQNSNGTTFRCLRRRDFIKTGTFNKNFGYFSDQTIQILGVSTAVSDAICYHYNPDTLSEVFYSARWIGRAPRFEQTFRNILRYTFLNSIRMSYRKIKAGAPWEFLIFKLVFDFGILCGILFKNHKQNYAK